MDKPNQLNYTHDLPQILNMAELITTSECFLIKKVDDAIPDDSVKTSCIPNLLSLKHEDVPFLSLPSDSGPHKFEYDTQGLEATCPDNKGHLSSSVSGLHLQGNTSLVASKNLSANCFSNSFALESKRKKLKNSDNMFEKSPSK
ncbi:uncharacterized protein LOC136041655 isoform X2 [Artemia franciscana]|uniref:uncharacterized protein LOC136041655 isoform X2 n=1 Tax=Artemia franciscana TaxID=6661 RepID=UPI0032DA5050